MTTEEISRSRISVRLACRVLAHHEQTHVEVLPKALRVTHVDGIVHADGTIADDVERFEIGPDGLVSGCELMGWLGY